MTRRVVTLVPILLGGLAGAVVAFFESYPNAHRDSSAASRPALEVPASAEPARVAPAPRPAAAPPSAEITAPVPSPSATPPMPAASAIAAMPETPRPVFDLSEPTTPQDLMSQQIRCNQKIPEDCERAAAALESGSLGSKDPPRARSLRRIALTLYVKQCESGRAAACSRLAEMYDTGFIVQTNPRNAEALRKRVTELCERHPNDPECAH